MSDNELNAASKLDLQRDALHYGILRKSGRYPWGSGKDEFQRSMDFFAYVNELKKKGVPEKDIATAIGLAAPDDKGFSVAQLRSTTTIAKEQKIQHETNRAVQLREKGVSIEEIAKDLKIPAPTVRLRLKNSENMKKASLLNTADILRKNVDEHDIVDIGKGVEHHLGISPERLKAAVGVLHDEEYQTYTLQVRQPGTKQNTNQKVLVKPGVSYGEAKKMTDRIHTMGEWTEDNGLTFIGVHPPLSISSKRLKVNFAEDGGAQQDGVVYVRRGAKDLDMGKNTYAQVRIMIDNTHYIKGMAIATDDMPVGVDLVFNTNKKRGTPILGDKNNTVLKNLEDDETNPFGSIINRQIVKTDPKTGKEHVVSGINLLREEGEWDWRESLPSQMLAKQPHSLIKSQLQVTRDEVKNRLNEINTITNAVVRKKALEDLADKVDSDAVDLRAAALSGRQKTCVILPFPKMPKNEIYAPNFETGERVVLIRYPHGGRFEIPEVTVNNNNRTAKKLLGNAIDAIGIHPSVAEKLSGADFDGDTVVVIPNRSGKIKGSQSLGSQAKVYEDALNGFDAKRIYGGYEEKDGKGNFKLMTQTGLEMGKITNLITDMSVQGAKPEHVIRAVKHSMVVIDAEKHKLDYKRSKQENGIKQLVTLYQTTKNPDGSVKVGGASTLLSQATAKQRIDERKAALVGKGGRINAETGALQFEPTGRMTNPFDKKTLTYLTDQKKPVQIEVKRLALTDDAFTLVRDKADPVERLYAEHANEMKALANAARLASVRTPNPLRNAQARVVFKPEVDKLAADLKAAEKQKPLDRRARVIAGMNIKAKLLDDPTLRLDSERKRKVEKQAEAIARKRLGLEKPVIEITDRQWAAIQSGAVSSSMLRSILGFADKKRIEELSMPRKNTVITKSVGAMAKAMLAAGSTNADIAAALGISPSTLRAAIQRGDL
jgi:hypothetical protein